MHQLKNNIFFVSPILFSFVSYSFINSCAGDHTTLDSKTSLANPSADKAAEQGFVSSNHGFASLSLMTPEEKASKGSDLDKQLLQSPQLFTGAALRFDQSCAKSIPEDVSYLAEIWTQPLLLSIFSGGDDWFMSALQSLQESSQNGEYQRPTSPVHPNLISRLNFGTNPNLWILNAVRFRPFNDEVQIKLNYELDVTEAVIKKISDDPNSGTDFTTRSIVSASMIHSIAITPGYVEEFKRDVQAIGTAQDKSACKILRILNKYIANEGLDMSSPLRSSYFFLHSNIFDLSENVNEWRLTELKVVKGDTKIQPATVTPSVMGIPMMFPGASPTTTANQAPPRIVMGTYDNQMGMVDHERRLRLVPMKFKKYYAVGTVGDIEEATDKDPENIWFSGSRADVGDTTNMRVINLLYDKQSGQPISNKNHLAFQHDETFTCAQCHGRRTLGRVTSDMTVLPEAPAMQFRHIGFGDGGNDTASCNGFWGVMRSGIKPSLSPYLTNLANAAAINDYETIFTRKVEPSPGMLGSVWNQKRCVIFKN